MNLARKSVVFVALSATFLLGPVSAQATPLGSGGGAFTAQNQETHWFAFTCATLPNGSIHGHAVVVEPASRGFLQMRITSATVVGGMLAVAGPITQAVRTPPIFAVGGTAFFVVDDNGVGGPVPDRFAGVGAVPRNFGNLTVQQIIALIGPPPPAAFAPLLVGNIKIH